MIYKAILGNKYIINDFIEKVELRLEHNIILPATIYKYDRNQSSLIHHFYIQ